MTIKLAERHNLLRQWRKFDTSGSCAGCIPFERLGELLTSMGGDYTPDEVAEVRARIHEDQARYITFQEFLRWWAGDGAVDGLVNESEIRAVISKLKKLKATHAALLDDHARTQQQLSAALQAATAAPATAAADAKPRAAEGSAGDGALLSRLEELSRELGTARGELSARERECARLTEDCTRLTEECATASEVRRARSPRGIVRDESAERGGPHIAPCPSQDRRRGAEALAEAQRDVAAHAAKSDLLDTTVTSVRRALPAAPAGNMADALPRRSPSPSCSPPPLAAPSAHAAPGRSSDSYGSPRRSGGPRPPGGRDLSRVP